MSTHDTTTPGPARHPAPSTMIVAKAPDGLTAAHAEAPTSPTEAPNGASRRPWMWSIGGVVLLAALAGGGVWFVLSLGTVSTDDAYVNGHVTFVAARVPGQVAQVHVDDNNPVHKGDILVQLDPEPYQVQVEIAQAAVTAAQADLVTAQAQAMQR